MSKKRKRKSTNKFKLKHPREVGKFYKAPDSKGGHPVRVYVSKPKKDTYFIQRFSKTDRKDRKKLKHNIDPNSNEDQWLVKKPKAVGFDDIIFDSKYANYRIHPDDENTVKKYQRFNLKKNKK